MSHSESPRKQSAITKQIISSEFEVVETEAEHVTVIMIVIVILKILHFTSIHNDEKNNFLDGWLMRNEATQTRSVNPEVFL